MIKKETWKIRVSKTNPNMSTKQKTKKNKKTKNKQMDRSYLSIVWHKIYQNKPSSTVQDCPSTARFVFVSFCLLIRTDKANELDNQHKNKNNWNWTNKSLQLNTTQQNTIQYNTIPTNQPTNQLLFELHALISLFQMTVDLIWFDWIWFGRVLQPLFLDSLILVVFLIGFHFGICQKNPL